MFGRSGRSILDALLDFISIHIINFLFIPLTCNAEN